MIEGARKVDAGIGLVFLGVGINFVVLCLFIMFTPGHSFGTGPRTGIVFYGSNETIAGLLALSMIVLVLCSLRAFATPFPINLIAILISAPVAYYLTTINSATYAAGPIISLLGGIVGLIQTKRL